MLKQRVITAILLAVVLVAATTVLPPFYFAVFFTAPILLAVYEWGSFTGPASSRFKAGYTAGASIMIVGLYPLLGISPEAQSIDNARVVVLLILALLFWLMVLNFLWSYPQQVGKWNGESKIALMGLFVLLPAWVGLVQLKYFDESGLLVLAVIALVSAADIGGYFTGRTLGKTPLAPRLSPKKTREGFYGGLGFCVLVSLVFVPVAADRFRQFTATEFVTLLAASAVLAVFSVFGDLLVSMLKRNRGLKDSGKLLPGHGGILDRIDSLTAAMPVFVLVVSTLFAGEL